MSIPTIKTAFIAGELAPSLFGHVDLAKFGIGASTMRNGFVNYRGAYYSRAGTAYALQSKQPYGTPPRLVKFQFNINQGYALEFGQNYMRVFTDGAPVLEPTVPITAITQANPCFVSANTSYSNGDWVFIQNVAGMTELNDSFFAVENVTPTSFSLNDLRGNPVDSTAYAPYTGGGTVSRVFTLATPWLAVDLPLLKFTQSADVMSLVHPYYPPYDLSRITASNWVLTQTTFSTSTAAPAVTSATATVNPSGATSPPTLPTAYAYAVTAVDAASGQESIASEIANVTDSVDISSTAGSIVIQWTPVGTASTYNIYKAPASYNTNPNSATDATPVPTGSPLGYIGTSYGIQFVDSNITPDFTQVPPTHNNPFAPGAVVGFTITNQGDNNYSAANVFVASSTGSGFVGEVVISQPVGQTNQGAVTNIIVINGGQGYLPTDTAGITGDGTSAAATPVIGPQSGTYPGVVAYFQQRRVYASSLNNPDTYWMSQPGAFLNFDTSIPVTAADAITGTPWSQQVDGIQWLIPMPGGLVTLTGLGAWQITGAGGSALNPQPITPSSQQAQPQAFNGANAIVQPITINYDILYVQSKGSIVRDLQYNYWVNIYTGSDLTQLSSHLFTNFIIQQWAWCEEPYKIVWAVRNDGALLSLTYVKEQEVYGWARHDTNGQVVSVCSVTEPPVDALYLAVARSADTVGTEQFYYIERMNNRIWQTAEDDWCVDCGVAFEMPEPDAILLASTAAPGLVGFTSSAPVFTPASVSQVIRMSGGIATIAVYSNPTNVVARWNLPPSALVPNDPNNNVVPALPGQWTMTPQVQKVTGLQHLAGLTVTGLADGIPVPPTVVAADGSVTLPFPASNIKLGLPFTAQLQSVYLNEGGQPTDQGRRKDVTAVTVRVDASPNLTVGTNQPDGSTQSPIRLVMPWTAMQTIPAPGSQYAPPATYLAPGGGTVTQPFTGDIRQNVQSSWQKPGQIAVQQTGPQRMQVTAFIPGDAGRGSA